jgi:hypothetical protein
VRRPAIVGSNPQATVRQHDAPDMDKEGGQGVSARPEASGRESNP